MRHYAALVTKAREIHWPERFKSDLIRHDKAWLRARPDDERFVWSVYQYGTWVIHEKTDDSFPRAMHEVNPEARFFGWTGDELVELVSWRSVAPFLRGDSYGRKP